MARKAPAKKNTPANRPKRPRDPNQLAHALIQEMTERNEGTEKPGVPPEISRYMAAIGKAGGKIGGKKRLTSLSQERRSEIAFKAAQSRWAKKKKKA